MWPAKAALYAVMALQSEINPRLLNTARELAGGSIIMLPSTAKDFDNPEIAADLERGGGAAEDHGAEPPVRYAHPHQHRHLDVGEPDVETHRAATGHVGLDSTSLEREQDLGARAERAGEWDVEEHAGERPLPALDPGRRGAAEVAARIAHFGADGGAGSPSWGRALGGERGGDGQQEAAGDRCEVGWHRPQSRESPRQDLRGHAGAAQRNTQAGNTLSGSNSWRTWPKTRRRSGSAERVNW